MDIKLSHVMVISFYDDDDDIKQSEEQIMLKQNLLPISKQTPKPMASLVLGWCVLWKNQNLVSNEMG